MDEETQEVEPLDELPEDPDNDFEPVEEAEPLDTETNVSTEPDVVAESSTDDGRATASPNLPPIPLPDIMTDDEIEALRAEGMSDRAIAIIGQVGLRSAQRMESSMLAGASVYEQAMQSAPEYARIIGGRVRQHLATQRPETRQTQVGLNLAMASALLEEANQNPDSPTAFIDALVRHAGLAKGVRPTNTPPGPKTPTQLPAQRVPTPSGSPAARAGGGRPSNTMAKAQSLLGTNRAAIEDIFAEDN